MRRVASVVVFVTLFAMVGVARASSVDDLKKEVEKLRKEISQKQDGASAPIGKVDGMVAGKYGPNTPVTTKSGKLTIGGLVQVWYQAVQNDHRGLFQPSDHNNRSNDPTDDFPAETNELHDNDTMRIRRTELRFTLDIHENVTAYVMMDPTRESNIYYLPLPTFPAHNEVFKNPINTSGFGSRIRPQLLQDAYINYHGVIPHHDVTIGQFKPPAGEEAWRNSGQLEFVERAMVTGINNVRDIGVMLHGSWVDGRVQYWVGAFNGPDGTVLTDPEIVEGGNRSDDNDAKDIAWRVAARPVWNPDAWYGRLELGYHRTDGYRGESSAMNVPGGTVDTPLNGLNSPKTAINRQGAWAWYRPGDKVKGFWLRGEWGSGHDRYSFFQQPTTALALGGSGSGTQLSPTPVTASGWYFGTGYKISDSIFAEDLKAGGGLSKFLYDLEFAFRYETYQNIAVEDPVNPDRHTDQFKTTAYTAGINYYVNLHGGKIRAHDAKIQANYIWVAEPDSSRAKLEGIHNMRNDVFVVSFQVMF